MTKSFWNAADNCSSVGKVAWLLSVSGEYNKHLDRTHADISTFMMITVPESKLFRDSFLLEKAIN